MKTELRAENLAAFRECFGTFHDAVIHSFHYDMFSRRIGARRIQIVVGTHDWAVKSEDNWINITFEIEDITNLVLKIPPKYVGCIIFRLGIAFFDDQIHFNFIDGDPSDDPQQYVERTNIKGSQFLVSGKRCFWSTAPYQERTD